jgi:hypothetical protein
MVDGSKFKGTGMSGRWIGEMEGDQKPKAHMKK